MELERPAWAPAPGQAAVFYDEAGAVLGGGRITTAASEASLAEASDRSRGALASADPAAPPPSAIGSARA